MLLLSQHGFCCPFVLPFGHWYFGHWPWILCMLRQPHVTLQLRVRCLCPSQLSLSKQLQRNRGTVILAGETVRDWPWKSCGCHQTHALCISFTAVNSALAMDESLVVEGSAGGDRREMAWQGRQGQGWAINLCWGSISPRCVCGLPGALQGL